MNSPAKTFGELLRRHRKQRRKKVGSSLRIFTQADMANHLKTLLNSPWARISTVTVMRWESGEHKPAPEMQAAILNLLDTESSGKAQGHILVEVKS